MKIFHLSDLHIGLKLLNADLLEDQAYILDRITDLAAAERPDAVVIAGDLYDKPVPPAEAVALFDHFVTGLRLAAPEAEIMMISGNHDSAARTNLFRGLLSREKVHMIGLPPEKPEDHIEKVTLRDAFGPVNFYLLPFVRPSMIRLITGTRENGTSLSYDEAVRCLLAREQVDTSERNVLVSHQFYLPDGKSAEEVERMSSEVQTVGNIDQVSAEALRPFDYAALGHIHKPMKVGSDIYRYPGTPMACSVDEAGQRKGILEVGLGKKGDTAVRELPLKPLREIRVLRGTLAEVLRLPSEDYVSVVLTDTADLDVMDMQDRLRGAFPNLLEVRRENVLRADYSAQYSPREEKSPYELCLDFLGETDEEEKALLRDVLNTIGEERE
jgi:exonuclease SbcD